jgi:hypothetical protein
MYRSWFPNWRKPALRSIPGRLSQVIPRTNFSIREGACPPPRQEPQLRENTRDVRRPHHIPAYGLVGLLVVLSLLPVSLPAALGQESPAAPPARGKAEVAAEPEDDDPATAPDEETRKRRLLKRILPPGQLTPEQQEKAERLSKIAAAQGTDPTAIVGRFQLSSRYIDLPGNSRVTTLVGRVDLALRNNWLLRVDVPQVWTDPNLPGVPNQSGLSDLFVRTGGRVYSAPGYAFFAGADFTFPTAADPPGPPLGLGRYTIGPLAASARVFPNIHSFLFGLIQHQTSIGGDPSRRDVEFSRFALLWNTIWGEQWWTQAQGTIILDWNRKTRSGMTLEFQGGHRLTRKWLVYLQPGVGVWGRDVLGNYDWSMEVGFRRMFPSF